MQPVWHRLVALGAWLAESLLRFYGVLFLAGGGLFFYWSARGLLAYQRGVREAWTEPLACAVGLIAGGACWWAAYRLIRGKMKVSLARSGLSPEEEAMLETVEELEQTDPAAAVQLLDTFYIRQGEAEERRRDELRRLAPHEMRAAVELRRTLQKNLELSALARKEFAADDPALLAQIDAEDSNVRRELAQLEATIDRLRLSSAGGG